MRLFFDVETLPSLSPDAREEVRKTIRPPANYKKPETIAEWWANEGEAAVERTYRSQALDAAQGELCAVGFATDAMAPVSLVRELAESEGVFIRRALAAIEQLRQDASPSADWPAEPYFIAHNAAFDLGFLLRRCWVHGVKPPFTLPEPNSRPGRDFGCTMTLWAGPRERIALSAICKALGLPDPKAEGIDGGDVLDLWREGRHQELAAYNVRDVAGVRAVWYRLHWEADPAVRAFT